MGVLLDQIKADTAVFLDAENGFAETHDIDGVQVTAVLEPLPVGRADQRHPGVLVLRRRLFAEASAVPLPVAGQELTIDGEAWIVEDAVEDAGLLEILLARYES